MQKIKLANGAFVENVQEINDYKDRDILNQDFRKILNITIADTDFETLCNTFSNPENLTSIEIYNLVDEECVPVGLESNFTILNRISANVQNNTFTVQLHQKSLLEQQIEETQLAVAELGMLLGGVL